MPTITTGDNLQTARETLGTSTVQLREAAKRAMLIALAGAAARQDSAAVADICAGLKALSDAII